MAGEKVFDNVRTITSQKVTFEINDWQNDLVRLFLSMAAKLRQVFLAEATGFFFKFCTLNRQLLSPELSL